MAACLLFKAPGGQVKSFKTNRAQFFADQTIDYDAYNEHEVISFKKILCPEKSFFVRLINIDFSSIWAIVVGNLGINQMLISLNSIFCGKK